MLTSVAVDVASEVMVEAVVAIADVCGADEKTKVIVSDVTQGVLGGVLIFTGADVVTGAAMVGSGAGGLVGGYAAEAVYEYATGEDSDIAFMYGSAAGNIIGGIVGGKIGKTAENSLKICEQTTTVAENTQPKLSKAEILERNKGFYMNNKSLRCSKVNIITLKNKLHWLQKVV